MTPTAIRITQASCSSFALSAAVLGFAASDAAAQSAADVAVPAGQTTSLTTTITIVHGTFGTDSDSQTKTHTIAGTSHLEMPSAAPPFASVTAQPLVFNVGGANYTFSFFCFPFIGCQTLGVNLANVTLTLQDASSAVAAGTGNFSFPNSTWDITADYTTSGIDNGTYNLIDVGTATFSGKLTATATTVTLNQLSLSTIHFDVPAESLPAGINSIGLDITANLSTNSLVGPWGPACIPADLNCDGEVDGIDLSFILGGWGGPSGDTNGDGTTDGIDLSAVLGSWGT